MSGEEWAAVDAYITNLLVHQDEALEAAVEESRAAGLPAINVTPTQGKMLHILARMHGARDILEIGTLAGYSTIWLGRALPAGGRLITLELDPKHIRIARSNIARAGLDAVVEVKQGRALDTLAQLVAAGRKPFDLIFIDADKGSLPDYFAWALKLSHPGTLIIVDNVVRDGMVLDASSTDPDIQGVRSFNEAVAAEPRVTATEIQTVGTKGYDGFALVLVLAD
ncbi:MAG: O-methyltransferase [Nitrososphaerales archaeon]|jgi:predicted O-methyltransferase YrrM